MSKTLRVLLAGLLGALAPTFARAEDLAREDLLRAKAATVLVKVRRGSLLATGSGFFLGDGLVVTNAHVLGMLEPGSPLPRIELVVSSGVAGKERTLSAELLALDRASDLAYLEPKGTEGLQLASLELGSERELRETQGIYVFGFPFGTALARGRNPTVTVHDGSISSLRRDAAGTLTRLQIDGNLNPGNSGGPILDRQGRLVAVSVSTIRGTTLSFGIPCGALRRGLAGFAVEVQLRKRARQGQLLTLEAELKVVDPLRQLRAPQLVTWLRAPPREERLQEQIHPLQWSAAKRAYTGRLEVTLPEGHELRYQARASSRGSALRATPVRTLRSTPPPEHAPRTPAPAQPLPDLPSAPKASPGPTPPEDGSPSAARRVRLVELEHELLEIVPAAQGQRVYALLRDRSEVVVFAAETFEELSSVQVPRFPKSLALQGDLLYVACPSSRVISVLEASTLRHRRALRVDASPGLAPTLLLGPNEQGEVLALWRSAEGDALQLLMAHGSPERTREIYRRSDGLGLAWAYPLGRQLLLGRPRSGPRDANWRSAVVSAPGSAPKQHKPPAHLCSGERVDLRDAVLRPPVQIGHDLVAVSTASATHLFRGDFQTCVGVIPGQLAGEDRRKRVLVTAEAHWNMLTIHRWSRSQRRSVGELRIARPAGHHRKSSTRCLLYVPSSELLVAATGGSLFLFPCGPQEVDQPRPTKARVGEALRYQPRWDRPRGSPRYALASGPPGAKVDSTTGVFSWTPGEFEVGQWEISIVAVVGRARYQVAKWSIQVDSP